MSFLTKLPRGLYKSNAFDGFDGALTTYNRGTAHAMAWVCQLAYETDDTEKIEGICAKWKIHIQPAGIISEEIVTPLPKASTQAIVCERDDAVIIAFAGTDPPVVADWVSNFDIGIASSGAANGFAVAAQVVEKTLEALLAEAMQSKPVLITGHSLGGAVAVLSASRIERAHPGRVNAVYTFGMPRPGSEAFASAYNETLGNRTYRLVHGLDVVPTVAPSFLGFRHVGRHLHCASRERFDTAVLGALHPISDEPQFEAGVSARLKNILHGPPSDILPVAARQALADLLAGRSREGERSDAGGLIIELLPPPLRDHMPDRYISATA